MRSALKFVLPALLTSLTLAACGSSSGGSGSSSQATTAPSPQSTNASSSDGTAIVKTASNATIGGTVLVDSKGMTLYHLAGEQNGKFICTSTACVGVWHPVSASTGTPSGAVGSLGTVKRPDGTTQVTYKGWPLYTFAQDQHAGEAKGQGLKDVGTWTAVTVSAGAKQPASTEAASSPQPAPAESSSSQSSPKSGGGGGYAY
jgi:predicted lipoprotein with Yx(FWY)xxD motif